MNRSPAPALTPNRCDDSVGATRSRNVPVDLIRLADEGHGLVRLANRLRVYPAIADFLDRHLALPSS